MLGLILNLITFAFGFYIGIKINRTIMKYLDKK